MIVTVPKRLVGPAAALGLLLVAFLASADSCGGSSSNAAETNQVSSQQQMYGRNQPVPLYQYSAERAALTQILSQRTSGTLNTWTVWFSNSGVALGMCASKGYPIPYSTELTNPLQPDRDGGFTGGAPVAVDQMDPQGTYPSQNTLATWILCIDPATGGIHAQYVEPLVIAYTYPVEIRGGQVVQTGTSNAGSAITLGGKP